MPHPKHPLWQQIAGLVNRANFRLDMRWNGAENCFIATAYPEWDKENAFRLAVFTLDGDMATILNSRVERLAARTDQQLLRRRPNSESMSAGQGVEQLELLLEKYAEALKNINQWARPGSPPSLLPQPSIVLDDVIMANFNLQPFTQGQISGKGYIVPKFMTGPRAYIIEPFSGTMVLVAPGTEQDDSLLLDRETLEDVAYAARMGTENDVLCFVLHDDRVVDAAVNFRWLGDGPLSLRLVQDLDDLCDLFDADVIEDDSGVNIGVCVYGVDESDEVAETMLTPFLPVDELMAYIGSDAGRAAINQTAKQLFGEEWDAANMTWAWEGDDSPEFDQDAPEVDSETLRQTMQRAVSVGKKLIEADLLSTPELRRAVAMLERHFGPAENPPDTDPEFLAFTVMQLARLADEMENGDETTEPPLAV